MSQLHALAIAVDTAPTDLRDPRIAALAEGGIIVHRASGWRFRRQAVIEIAAVGIRIDPAADRHDPRTTLYTSHVDPGRKFDGCLPTLFNDLQAADAARQPTLEQALAGIRTAARGFGPELLAIHHAGLHRYAEADVVALAAAALTPDDPRCACTRDLAQHLWPHAERRDVHALANGCRLYDRIPEHHPRATVLDAIACAELLAAQCRAIAAAGYAVTPALLRDWTVCPPERPAWPRPDFGGHR